MKLYVDRVALSRSYHLRQLRSVRRLLPEDIFVTNRVDYCNASLYGIFAGVTRAIVCRCPAYLGDICIPVDTNAARARQHFADRSDLIIPRTRFQSMQLLRLGTDHLE